MNAADKITAKINAQPEAEAIMVYTGLRIAHDDARREKENNAAGLMQVMAMAGDALEARIGEDRFDDLIDAIDAQIYA